jgi:hypothetical protein
VYNTVSTVHIYQRCIGSLNIRIPPFALVAVTVPHLHRSLHGYHVGMKLRVTRLRLSDMMVMSSVVMKLGSKGIRKVVTRKTDMIA